MKLYYAPGACSLAPHIVAHEAAVPVEAVRVDFATRKGADGRDLSAVNPKGYVPALQLDNGEVLTEVATVVQYLADQNPQVGLVPAFGTMERYRLMEWLTFISSELHKGFGALWNPQSPAEVKQAAKDKLATRFAYLDAELAGRDYLTGSRFTAADAYAFTILNWSGMHHVDLTPYRNVQAFMQRVAARPRVQDALRAEGLLHDQAA